MTSGLVAKSLDAHTVLASMNKVTLILVPGHFGFLGNEETDKLARQASTMPLLGPEPSLGISVQQEKQSRTGLSKNTTAPGEICQVLVIASFL